MGTTPSAVTHLFMFRPAELLQPTLTAPSEHSRQQSQVRFPQGTKDNAQMGGLGTGRAVGENGGGNLCFTPSQKLGLYHDKAAGPVNYCCYIVIKMHI